MDFMNRGTQVPGQQAPHPAPAAVADAKTKRFSGRGPAEKPKWMQVGTVALLFAITLLAVAVIIFMGVGRPTEAAQINKDGWQAVDIAVGGANGSDQIYFGKITKLTNNYVTLDKVYYIPATQNNNGTITLAQLVCQLDKPQDRMVINRNQLVYWENLQKDSKVVTTIEKYIKDNPKGADCNAQSSTGAATSNSAANGTTSTGTTSTTGTTGTTSTTGTTGTTKANP